MKNLLKARISELSVCEVYLLHFEMEGLLEALRRDMRRESDLAILAEGAEHLRHGYNARLDIKLLEVLRPKTCSHYDETKPHCIKCAQEAQAIAAEIEQVVSTSGL